MEIKKPEWSACTGQVSIKNGHNQPDWHIEKGMHVSARYGDNYVHMKVIESQKDGSYLATIESFDPVNSAIPITRPTDLSEGDYVQIDWGHIYGIRP